MTRKDYTPTPLADVDHIIEERRATLIFFRRFRQSPEKVWKALTEPQQLAEWAPYITNRSLSTPGPATLTMTDSDTATPSPITVLRAEAPYILKYNWGEGLLVWELKPDGEGTHLTLHHTVTSPDWMPKVAAGWHMCLDVMEKFLEGHPIGRIVGMECMNYGWQSLHDAYAYALGVEATPLTNVSES